MAKASSKSTKRKPEKDCGPPDLESVLDTVRSMWTATERDDVAEQNLLRKKIVNQIEGLKKQINGKVVRQSTTGNECQTPLFPIGDEDTETPFPRFDESQLRVCGKDLADHALKYIPESAAFPDIKSYRAHLVDTLPFNSVATRRRNASYLINRFFPGEKLHRDLSSFSGAAAGHMCLGDVLFYLAARSEQIIGLTAEQVVWPSLADGGVSRSRIAEFVRGKLLSEKGSKETTSAIVRSYQHFGIGEMTRTRLNVSIRQGHLASFAYILHLEYPEPGMHTFEKLLDGPMHKWLLWERDWIIEQLYCCRQEGLLTKVSEIDAMRQFTTRYSLAEATEHIVKLIGKENA